MALFGNLFGGKDKAAARKAQKQATQMAQDTASTAQQFGAAAQKMGQGFDAGTQASMGTSAADYMAKAQQAATGLASQQATAAAQAGTQQAVQAARGAGMNRGAAAQMASQQAANTYTGALNQGIQQGMQQYQGATQQFAGQGAEMANRQMQAVGAQQGAAGQIAGVGQQQMAAGQAQQGATLGAIGKGLGAILSDERCKMNIEDEGLSLSQYYDLLRRRDREMRGKRSTLDEVAESVRPVKFDYKTDEPGTEHVGVLAQDLENTPLKNAVKETPDGTKVIDNNELSPAMLNLIVQLARRVQNLEGVK